MWNRRTINAADSDGVTAVGSDIDKGVIHGIVLKLSKISQEISLPSLWREKSILRTIIYKNNNQQRGQKEFRGLKAILKYLERLQEINISEFVLGHVKLWPRIDVLNNNSDSKNVCIPSHSVLQTLLLKFMGTAQLVLKAIQICQDTYLYIQRHLSLGYFIALNLTTASIVSRIWVLLKDVLHFVVDGYQLIRPLLDSYYLGSGQSSEVRDAGVFPLSLLVWIGFDFFKINEQSGKCSDKTSSKSSSSKVLFKMFSDGNPNTSSNGDKQEDDQMVELPLRQPSMEVDLGEPVSDFMYPVEQANDNLAENAVTQKLDSDVPEIEEYLITKVPVEKAQEVREISPEKTTGKKVDDVLKNTEFSEVQQDDKLDDFCKNDNVYVNDKRKKLKKKRKILAKKRLKKKRRKDIDLGLDADEDVVRNHFICTGYPKEDEIDGSSDCTNVEVNTDCVIEGDHLKKKRRNKLKLTKKLKVLTRKGLHKKSDNGNCLKDATAETRTGITKLKYKKPENLLDENDIYLGDITDDLGSEIDLKSKKTKKGKKRTQDEIDSHNTNVHVEEIEDIFGTKIHKKKKKLMSDSPRQTLETGKGSTDKDEEKGKVNFKVSKKKKRQKDCVDIDEIPNGLGSQGYVENNASGGNMKFDLNVEKEVNGDFLSLEKQISGKITKKRKKELKGKLNNRIKSDVDEFDDVAEKTEKSTFIKKMKKRVKRLKKGHLSNSETIGRINKKESSIEDIFSVLDL